MGNHTTSTSRLTLDMTVREAVLAIAGGNPGAIMVCAQVMEWTPTVDPDCMLGGLAVLMDFDALGIYEHRIWMLYKDVCRENITTMLAVLRAHQLGGLAGATTDAILYAMDNRGAGLDLDAVTTAVQDELPRFSAGA